MKVTGYNVFVTAALKGVSLLLDNGDRKKITSADPNHIALLIDLLRNEDPVYYNSEKEMLYTGEEPAGEGEEN